MSEGWIKLHRKSLDSQVFQSETLWKVWCYCLMRANHTKQCVSVSTGRGTSQVEVEPGQFVFGRKEAAKTLSMKPSSIYKRIKKLETIGNLATQANTHFSIITICHWTEYQDFDLQLEKASGLPSSYQVTVKEQPSSTDKNVKKKKKKKEESPSRFSFPVIGQDDDWVLPQSKLDEWKQSFASVDVEQQVALARQWVLDSPDRRKTVRGMTRFLGGWLTRAVNSGTRQTQPYGQQPAPQKARPISELPGVEGIFDA